MSVTLLRARSTESLLDVLDRILDKGIVWDAWLRIAWIGISIGQHQTITIASQSFPDHEEVILPSQFHELEERLKRRERKRRKKYTVH